MNMRKLVLSITTIVPTASVKEIPVEGVCGLGKYYRCDEVDAQIADLTAKLERVRKLVKQIEKNSPDAWARMKAEQILRECLNSQRC